jgi:pyruvate-ferredoxin/flavodoxin oxidoreductase
LFEDNAEFGYGMNLAYTQRRNKIAEDMVANMETVNDETKAAFNAWLENMNNAEGSVSASEAVKAALANEKADLTSIRENLDCLVKKSVWIFGGDGWAYDIGYGGLDHVLASNQDVNIMVFDTEVYSNTGGQSSKATPTGAIAQFAAAGKEVKKKDLAAIAMSYGYVYVAQIAQGADYAQCVKAIAEAEAYPGPSLIIAYAPCINHGIKGGMKNAQTEEKNAVASGYWHLFRFDPRLALEGKNPFQLDSKEPTASYKEFIESEVRYNRLSRSNPERAQYLFEKAEADAKAKYEMLVKKAEK